MCPEGDETMPNGSSAELHLISPFPLVAPRAAAAPVPNHAQAPPLSLVDKPLPIAEAASKQRFKLLLNITSEEMLELFLEDLIDFPFVLHLFSGPPNRQDGYAVMLRNQGVYCLEIDLLIDSRANMRCNDVYMKLCSLASLGLILFALIGIPCNIWSVHGR